MTLVINKFEDLKSFNYEIVDVSVMTLSWNVGWAGRWARPLTTYSLCAVDFLSFVLRQRAVIAVTAPPSTSSHMRGRQISGRAAKQRHLSSRNAHSLYARCESAQLDPKNYT